MKKSEFMKQVRISIVGLFGCICLILISSEPADEEKWFMQFFLSKGLAFLFGYVAYILTKRWESKGLLPDMEDE